MSASASLPIALDVAEQAMHWHQELQEREPSAATLLAWTHWRQAHPSHEHAWRRAEAFAQRMSDMRHPGQQYLARATLQPTLSRRGALKHLSLLLGAGAAAWYLKDSELAQDWSADYHTGIGEQRRLTLADGTQVQLNTDSAIKVSMDRQARRIKLLRGELMIIRDQGAPGRLLSVDTAQGRLDVAQARFSARQLLGVTQVSVYQGTLAIELAGARQAPIVLSAGEQARFSNRAVVSREAVAASAAAWTEGMLVAQGQPLAAFLADLSRYRRGHLVCDPAAANLRVSGTFPLAAPEQIILAVADTLHLEVRQFTRYWITLKGRTA
jgi:transmembrane sensor